MQDYISLICLALAWVISIFFAIYIYKKRVQLAQSNSSRFNINQFEVDDGVTDELLAQVPVWLARHGIKKNGENPASCAPLGKRATEVLEQYSRVFCDYKEDVLSRDFLFQEYKENPAFVQIGDNDSNVILMKKNQAEETIYNVYKDEFGYDSPAVYASTIDHYLAMEMLIEEGSGTV